MIFLSRRSHSRPHCIRTLLFFCCTSTSDCFRIFLSFNFQSFIFFRLCFFFLISFATFRSALSRRCCVKRASPEINLQSLTHIPLAFLSLACNFLFPVLFKLCIYHSQLNFDIVPESFLFPDFLHQIHVHP